MWDKRRSDFAPQAGPAPVEAPPAPVAPVESATRGTAIGPAISIIGEIYSEEDLFIDGQVKGSLELKDSRLTVGPNGKAQSNVKARDVIILGSVQGDVEASRKITIRRQGSLVGNIKSAGIVIDDEAYFKGSIDIVRKNAESATA
jgi:cytoskeletal protein CcmA (bactofilin family)